MKKIIGVLLAAGFLLGPSAALLGVASLVINPAAHADEVCPPGSEHLTVGDIPAELTAETADGETITLTQAHLSHAATIITIGSETEGINDRGMLIALMAALTESGLRNLSNTGEYPDSADHPNDGDGNDHDSLGLFQMRPEMGWGSVEELMDPDYQTEAFYGGPAGPNHPDPPGLLDINGWEDMDPGEAAQAVERSAYPDRYQNYQPVAETILSTLTQPATTSSEDTTIPETPHVVFPLPEGTWNKTSDYGWRTHPITGNRAFHAGTDYAAPDGTPMYAIADGRVVHAEATGGYGGLVIIEHTINAEPVASAYAHIWDHGFHVEVGDTVRAGDHIADVGSAGTSTGAHLHLEIREGGQHGDTTDPETWLSQHNATATEQSSTPQPTGEGCQTSPSAAGEPAPFTGEDPNAMVDDPTTDGQITARTAHILDQVRENFPDSAWVCYSPRPGQASDHPLGRACDGTFGNAIGEAVTGEALALGWEVSYWLEEHAELLGIDYLIWQGQIWVASRPDDGWQDYGGGGMHDPESITGGHYDHVHFSSVDSPQ